MKLLEALKILCDDPIETLGAISFVLGFAGIWIGLYLIGFH